MKLRWLPLALLAACSDPTEPIIEDPCAPVFACRSSGVDLEMVSLNIASSSIDSVTGLPIVQPPGMAIEVTIRNRGTDTAAAGVIDLMVGDYFATRTMPHAALPPGATYRGSVTLAIPNGGATSVKDDRMTVEASVWAPGDSVSENNQMSAGPVHLAIPLLDVTFTTAATALAGEPIELTMVARNYGTHAASPVQIIAACLYDGFRGCEPDSRTTAGTLTLPEIAPGAAREITMTMPLAPTGAWQDAAGRYSIYLCTGGTTYASSGWACFRFGRSILVRPSYEAVCGPPTLSSSAISLTGYNCGVRPTLPSFEAETQRYRFHIVALEVRSGVTYVLQRSDTSSPVRLYNSQGDVVHDYDPHPERIRVAAAEKIYLVMYSEAPALTIAMTSSEAN